MYTLDWHRGFSGFARWPPDGVYASQPVTLDWHTGFWTDILCFRGFAQSPSDGVNASKHVKSWPGILGFFGSAQWPSDYMYVPEHVNTRLTSWVFGFAQWPSGSVDMRNLRREERKPGECEGGCEEEEEEEGGFLEIHQFFQCFAMVLLDFSIITLMLPQCV